MTEKGEQLSPPIEFSYDSAKIWYRDRQHLQTIDGMYNGVQAIVTFEETPNQDAFDKALKELKKFADKGTEDYGWRWGNDKSKYGQFNDIELPNHNKYRIVDKTEEGDIGITLGIFGKGCYHRLTGKGKYNVREIDISDTRRKMKSVDQVMKEIKTIVEFVSKK